MKTTTKFCLILIFQSVASVSYAQPYGKPDADSPGDRMIQDYLKHETNRIHNRFMENTTTKEDWESSRQKREYEYFHMLGLWPKPDKTELKPTVTGTLDRDGYVVEKLHFQSRPGLYVTANLYRPAEKAAESNRLPAILYVCGHAFRGRNGNKTAYQSHGIWLARHGYVCLMLDTLQMGEIGAIHHGTYREHRWWWHSRGYTSAGVECWNGIRAIDYLISREDVDADRIGVTGISGGGAATFWIAAADPRIQVAVPVSGMADLPSYVPNRVINGHCDCMFLYNTFQWPWTQIAAMIAPRPMLFVNSDADPIFPMDANDRVINRLERIYSLYGAGDDVDSLVSIGGHAYRKDIRQASFRFLNTHLKSDPQPISDSEIDLVVDSENQPAHPIAPEELRVFPTDADIPTDELNTTIDQHFVPMARLEVPKANDFHDRKSSVVNGLRKIAFHYFPASIPAASPSSPGDTEQGMATSLTTENLISIELQRVTELPPTIVKRVLLFIRADGSESIPATVSSKFSDIDVIYSIDPRGVGESKWTRNNPPNYVERSHALLGRTVDMGRVWDVIATCKYLRAKHSNADVVACGSNASAVIAAYAMLLDDSISEAILDRPITSHMSNDAPHFLNVLRVCDVHDALGLLAPRKLTLLTSDHQFEDKVSAYYKASGQIDQLGER